MRSFVATNNSGKPFTPESDSMQADVETNRFIADILVVDDKLENIRLLSEFLSEQKYQVRKAISGQAALTAAKLLSPDLILLDINMPGMGGYDVCKQLKSDSATSTIPIIFLSAGSEISDKVQAFQAGGVDYITKPFQLEEVLARVQTQLTLQTLQKKLQNRNDQLQDTVLKLQHAQSELIQKEKLVNAGQIAAGISHEINNPLSFILGNLDPAAQYSQKLINLVQLYQEAFPDATPAIKCFFKENELDFLTQDFTNVVRSIRTGAERIRSVVNALHIFSRLDETGIKSIDVHASIESVLTILRCQLIVEDELINISIAKDYGEIPLLSGYANLFNQALLNLLQNAIDALKLKSNSSVDSAFRATIWISTTLTTEQTIKICIKDNGVGVSQENQIRLFEPFFTTKPVGQGVGLSLFSSYQIITKLHQGRLSYQMGLAGESEFTVEVPVN